MICHTGIWCTVYSNIIIYYTIAHLIRNDSRLEWRIFLFYGARLVMFYYTVYMWKVLKTDFIIYILLSRRHGAYIFDYPRLCVG